LTIVLLGVSGGFTSGFFALLNNSALADVYTICANQLTEGLQAAEAELRYDSSCKTLQPPQPPEVEPKTSVTCLTPDSCQAALATLETKLTKAQTDLETARTDNAAAALIRAQAEVKKVANILLQDTLRSARITKAEWVEKEKDLAKLTVSGDLSGVTLSMFKVKVGDTLVDPTTLSKSPDGSYTISFTAPPEKDPKEDRAVSLVFESAGVTVPGLPTYLPKKP